LLDPLIDVRPAKGQVDDALAEIRTETEKGGRVLVTVLTKRLAEELTSYLLDLDVKAKYLHSDIDTLERMQIIHDLRRGEFDVLIGINLLREGLDIPEVTLVTILDADKEGFLRSETSLIQTCGRAARNAKGRVVMYADKMTGAIRQAVAVTEERRQRQEIYNREHGITPKTIIKGVTQLVEEEAEIFDPTKEAPQELLAAEEEHEYLTLSEVRERINAYEVEMKQAAKEMRFEDAAHYRDLMQKYQKIELTLG
jgi:excinuclease ABC subunit B